jgi:hypothetical protein
MTDNDDLPAEVRRQDEEDELQIAAQAAGLRKDTEATHDDDLPEVRRQDEEAELQIAAQLAELRTDEDGLAARPRWRDLSLNPPPEFGSATARQTRKCPLNWDNGSV